MILFNAFPLWEHSWILPTAELNMLSSRGRFVIVYGKGKDEANSFKTNLHTDCTGNIVTKLNRHKTAFTPDYFQTFVVFKSRFRDTAGVWMQKHAHVPCVISVDCSYDRSLHESELDITWQTKHSCTHVWCLRKWLILHYNTLNYFSTVHIY